MPEGRGLAGPRPDGTPPEPERMKLQPLDVWAEIVMAAADQGGRNVPLQGGQAYKPNHNFWPDRQGLPQFAFGEIVLPDGPTLLPGRPFQAPVRFLVWPELEAEMQPGQTWRLQEATRIVGHGTILGLL